MRALHTLMALFSLAGAASAAFGDTVRLRGGAEHQGVVKLEELRLAGADGDLEVPRSSIREVRATEGGFEVVLADGSTVVGVPEDPALKLEVGLIVRSIPFTEIERIQLDAVPPDELLRQALKAGGFADARLATPEMGTLETPCPMRLELRLPARVPPPDAAWRSGQLGSFLCDDALSVPQVVLEVRAPRKGAVQLRMKFVVLVRPPQDKLSRLGVEVLLDGETVAKGGKAGASTEEGRATQVPVVLELARTDYERWRAGVQDAVLRLTLEAVND